MKKNKKNSEYNNVITFLKQTKEGKYAKIEPKSLPYSRLNAQTITIEEEYYYSIN